MNAPDLAIIAVTVVSLAHVVADYRVRMRVSDRQRLVGPAKTPAQDKTATGDEKPESAFDRQLRRPA